MNPSNDPSLTAWALDQMSAEERATYESALNQEPDLKAAADEFKDFCEFISTHVRDQESALTLEQRQKLMGPVNTKSESLGPETIATGSKPAPKSWWKTPAWILPLSAAAALIVLAAQFWNPQNTTPQLVATAPTTDSFSEVAPPPPAAPVPTTLPVAISQPAAESKMQQLASTDSWKPLLDDRSGLEKPAIRGQNLDSLTLSGSLAKNQDNVALGSVGTISPDNSTEMGASRSLQAQMKTSDGPEMLTYAPETKRGMALIPPAHVAIDAPTFTRGVMIDIGASATATGTTAVSASAPASRQSKVADAPPDERNFSDHRQSPAEPSPPPSKEGYRETYAPITENPLTQATRHPLSTFSIDVDTAAYANVRRFLNSGSAPPIDAVRIEELINYFPYDYEFPQRGEAPFTVAAAVAEAPWQPTHRLARIAIKARDVGMDRRQSNFVFLVDVSGSMDEPNKLPLVQQSLNLLTDQLTAEDRVAIVVYAGNSGLALSSTSGDQKDTLRQAIRQMKSGGSTHGSAGIRQAYEEAQKNFIKEGVNRVILCTDGDFNVGTTSPEELEKLIAEKAKGGVFLSVLGYGTGNTQDRTMETLADKGNGNYAYIDSLSEARKVLVDQMRGTLVTVAKDVKIQVEFNPTLVQSYRLIGYENRLLAKEDFNNDAKDAGEIGAGHTVTALYEIVPVGITNPDGRPLVDPLKYQSAPTAAPPDAAKTGEMMTVKFRYKKPEGEKSDLLEFPVRDENKNLRDSDPEFRFATAVASFGLLLRNSSCRGDLTWEQVRQLALGAKGQDTNGHRGEFIQLIDKARGILGEGRP